MDRTTYNEVSSRCDLCRLGECFKPISGCWVDETKGEFLLSFCEIDKPGRTCQHYQDLLIRFEENGAVRLYVSDEYQET